jgi:hypothetical protein
MKNRASFYSSFIACLCLLTSVCALADTVSVQQSEQGISYITGGISEDEADALKRYVKQFNLRVIFSEGASGRSITDVNVSIYNTQGQLVFSVNEAQPQLMLNLPNGTYTIGALYNGDKQSHKFTISSDKQKKIILNWKNVTDEDAMEENDRSSS